MRVVSYVCDSSGAPPHVEACLDLIKAREEEVDVLDVAAADDRDGARREAMLTVKEAVRIGPAPEALFDGKGRPDLSVGALVTEEPTGRRSLHVGADALEALHDGNGD